MAVNFNAPVLQLGFKLVCAVLAVVLSDDNAAYIKPLVSEFLNQAQHILIIGDTQIMADFIFLNVCCINGN